MNCPDGEELKRTDDNMSSLSPWKYCMQYDSLRYPQWINVAQCLCSGCLHPFTGAEIHGNVLSKEIHVEINVLRKFSLKHPFSKCNRKICEETTQKIPIGCHCQIANVQNV
ncbi:interleukin-17D-like [Styela clava]|uniref:interleukin-17D-like n=1 Tax=Styela clava TaxID=7725 RepID=UPI00193AA9BB|nr:interleukin-17D-like [Styela clava]